MKKSNTILLSLALLFSTLTANAQFNKPLQSANARKQSTDATYNIGLIGGGTLTQWIHFGGTGTHYSEPFTKCLGYMGGLSVERRLSNNKSIGIEALYAMRNVELTYNRFNFPIAINEWNDIVKTLDASYNEIIVQAPFTLYLDNTPASTIRPYIFAAPRVTVIQDGGKTYWCKNNLTTEEVTYDTVGINTSNFMPFNIGIVAGAGVLFRINTSNYYFLIKVDASYHAGLIETFTKSEEQDAVGTVIGAGYIDPTLLGKRFSGNADLKATFLFPLKKQLKGACMKWGEYD